jgi:hypothetical protein
MSQGQESVKETAMSYRVVNRILIGLVIIMVMVALLGKVTIAASDAGRTAADFLKIGIGAQSAGMAGAYSSVSTGAPAAYWNPAGLPRSDGGEILLGHSAWYQDISLEHISGAFPVHDRVSVAASFTYLNYGDIAGFDVSNNSTDNLTAHDWVGGLSLGVAVTEEFSLGVTGKYVNQKLDQFSASAIAADLGLRYQRDQVTFSLVAANLGTNLKFDQTEEKLPRSARVGVAARLLNGALLSAIEFEQPTAGGGVLKNGLEWTYDNQYFVRTGYRYELGQENQSFGSGLNMGAGFRYGAAEINYAFTPGDSRMSQELHRFSLVFRFAR